ncbi:MAG TPA: hypothetical protein VMI92_06690 [Steroidobacteraceae bacterium]|nr:hypothetical protein [Steroidobacteraceae bacterium]
MKALLLIGVLSLCGGCVTRFETRPYLPQSDDSGIAGIRYYEPRLYKLHYEFTVLVDRGGQVLGRAGNGTCVAIAQKEELTTLADYAHPRVLIEHPAPFSSDKLGVTLSNGVLTGLNVERSPQGNDLLATLEKASEASVLAAAAAGAQQACNAAPELTRIEAVTQP